MRMSRDALVGSALLFAVYGGRDALPGAIESRALPVRTPPTLSATPLRPEPGAIVRLALRAAPGDSVVTIRGADRITHIALEVDAEVSARDLSVEDAPRAERARDARRARTEK